ncbi:MAG TPA: SAM-dependent methyltransferase, partial [Thermoanaerobaculia bacterium]|nr:SAM-dependent methyltransferase [Thermoanaerobaculia bacterium]
GIGSIAVIAAWRLPGARFVTVEAQEQSIRLSRKSIRYNGLDSRFTLYEGDLRDQELLADEAPFDLVFGSPPYWPPGTAVEAEHSQAVAARFETRGNLADYAAAAVQALAPGGVFVFVAPLNASIGDAALVVLRRREVVFKEGRPPIIFLGLAGRRGDYPASLRTWIEPPLTIRTADGNITDEYSAIRLAFGFPPGIGEE